MVIKAVYGCGFGRKTKRVDGIYSADDCGVQRFASAFYIYGNLYEQLGGQQNCFRLEAKIV